MIKKSTTTKTTVEKNQISKFSTPNLKKLVVATLKDHQATDIVAINIKKISDFTDYLIIATANSTPHVKTLINKVCEALKKLQLKPLGIEGENTKEWMVIDFGDLVIHIMLENTRRFYCLEKLWGLR